MNPQERPMGVGRHSRSWRAPLALALALALTCAALPNVAAESQETPGAQAESGSQESASSQRTPRREAEAEAARSPARDASSTGRGTEAARAAGKGSPPSSGTENPPPSRRTESPAERIAPPIPPPPGDGALPKPTVPPLPEGKITIELSLAEALRIGLEKNFDIRIARLDHLSSYHDEIIARAAFDPFFTMGVDYSKNRRPTASFLDIGGGALVQAVQANPFETLSAFVGVRGLTPIGTAYDIRLNENSFDRPRATGLFGINPQVNSTAEIVLAQPLLKNAWYPFNTANVLLARNSQQLTYSQFQQAVIETIYLIEQTYWELAFALKNYESRAKALEVTLENLQNARRRFTVGTLAAIDVTITESQVALRRVEFTDAETILENARDALLDAINHRGEESLRERWVQGIEKGAYDDILVIPTTEADAEPLEFERDSAIYTALERRPEYRQVGLRLESQRVRVDVAENQTLPQLDLTAQWQQHGLSDDYDESFSSLSGGDFYSWALGVQLVIPIPNRGPKRELLKAEDALRRLHLERAQLESRILLEIDQTMRDLVSIQRRIQELDEHVRLQYIILEAERRKVEAGRSISYTVSTIENDLIDSQARALRAKADYEIAKAAFYRATGTLLDRHDIRLFDEAASP